MVFILGIIGDIDGSSGDELSGFIHNFRSGRNVNDLANFSLCGVSQTSSDSSLLLAWRWVLGFIGKLGTVCKIPVLLFATSLECECSTLMGVWGAVDIWLLILGVKWSDEMFTLIFSRGKETIMKSLLEQPRLLLLRWEPKREFIALGITHNKLFLICIGIDTTKDFFFDWWCLLILLWLALLVSGAVLFLSDWEWVNLFFILKSICFLGWLKRLADSLRNTSSKLFFCMTGLFAAREGLNGEPLNGNWELPHSWSEVGRTLLTTKGELHSDRWHSFPSSDISCKALLESTKKSSSTCVILVETLTGSSLSNFPHKPLSLTAKDTWFTSLVTDTALVFIADFRPFKLEPLYCLSTLLKLASELEIDSGCKLSEASFRPCLLGASLTHFPTQFNSFSTPSDSPLFSSNVTPANIPLPSSLPCNWPESCSECTRFFLPASSITWLLDSNSEVQVDSGSSILVLLSSPKSSGESKDVDVLFPSVLGFMGSITAILGLGWSSVGVTRLAVILTSSPVFLFLDLSPFCSFRLLDNVEHRTILITQLFLLATSSLVKAPTLHLFTFLDSSVTLPDEPSLSTGVSHSARVAPTFPSSDLLFPSNSILSSVISQTWPSLVAFFPFTKMSLVSLNLPISTDWEGSLTDSFLSSCLSSIIGASCAFSNNSVLILAVVASSASVWHSIFTCSVSEGNGAFSLWHDLSKLCGG